MPAHYQGNPQVEFLSDGRNIKLLQQLVFIDVNDQRWAVPANAVVDGASIPRIFWTFVGGPLEGRYRDASIIHDWFCDLRTRTWQDTHRVFYEAMLVSGVSAEKAKLLYFAVRWGGPRWERRVLENTNLASGERYNLQGGKKEWQIVSIPRPSDRLSLSDQETFIAEIEKKIDQYSIEQIDSISERPR